MVLNDDILRHICDLLPPETLRSASATHPVFFDRWIKEKYRRVDLSRSDKQSKRLWKHVQDSEWVARSVKSVHMRTWLVKPQTQTYQSRTENALNTVAMLFDKDHTKKQVKKRLEKRLKKDLWHITSLFSVLRGIQDYHIEWDKNPTFPPQLFTAFLQPLYAWRDTLTSLSIHIPVDLLNSFVTATLPNLQHIHVCLSSGKMSQGRINIHLDWLPRIPPQSQRHPHVVLRQDDTRVGEPGIIQVLPLPGHIPPPPRGLPHDPLRRRPPPRPPTVL
ncbi:hypothetical protein DFP72DRAFT_442645 [Ephemerocybe angulata]|uniref:F-box domain-containing protein n=1 Tax=Ephemerocybe angulata TaxID=980116 RepID=A0A8H6HU61_9AGAR|nr:hypothetical protein DFP72DRAFT_442645 [Tulosesus angulatus]